MRTSLETLGENVTGKVRFEQITCSRFQWANDMVCGALLAVGGPHPGRGHQGGDGHMQAEGHMPVCVVGQPDTGVQSDDLGPPHQDDIHNERQSLML